MSAVAVIQSPPRRPAAEELVWRLDAFNKFLLSLLPMEELTPGLGREACSTLGFTRMLFLRADCAWREAWAPLGCGLDIGALVAIGEPFATSTWIAASVTGRRAAFTGSARMNAVLPAAYMDAHGISALLCVPIYDSEGPVAAMLFDRGGEPFAVDAMLLDVALAVGESIGCALEATSSASAHGGARSTEPALTPRQLEILRMMARGVTNREIAELTGLSAFTVRDHISALLQRLEVSNRSAAVMRGWQLGLLGRDVAPV